MAAAASRVLLATKCPEGEDNLMSSLAFPSQNLPSQPPFTSQWTEFDHMTTLKSDPIMSKEMGLPWIDLGIHLSWGQGHLARG